ncbi:DUF1707 domain-containing protein [Nonomuraea typhae]|uniref:DUF1707 domain-containing protein n=1 Tax=Nonomuraea typhae TaxID=2603600 RepID=A0ABW7YWQ9_9ACTN
MTDRPEIRASDQDRDRIGEMLRVAVSEGRIDLEELNERLDRTYRARTLRELDEIVADLPGGGGPPTQAMPGPPTGALPATRHAPLPAPQPGEVLQLHTRSGKIRQEGRWVVPPRITAKAHRFGTVRIDFTRAECPYREVPVDVEITSWFGDVVIIVPVDWWVQDDEVVRRLMGAVHNRPIVSPSQAAVIVRLTGYVQTGDVWVRYRR